MDRSAQKVTGKVLDIPGYAHFEHLTTDEPLLKLLASTKAATLMQGLHCITGPIASGM